jgi:hypothetical protein
MAMKGTVGKSKNWAGAAMKKIARMAQPAGDGAYQVSAAEIADKLLERMSRGMAPRLFSHTVLAKISYLSGSPGDAE